MLLKWVFDHRTLLGSIGRCLNPCRFSLRCWWQPLGRIPDICFLVYLLWADIDLVGLLFSLPRNSAIHCDMAGNMANQATSSQIPSAAKATTTSTAPAHTSNAGRKRRSCLMCSKRKVKCDKQKPCICCVKAGIECVFPATASSRTEVGGTPELVEMLQRLEKAVQTLGPRNTEKAESTLRPGHEPSSDGDTQIDPRQRLTSRATIRETATETGAHICDQGNAVEAESTIQVQRPDGKAPSVSSSHAESPGKIIRDHGRDTYVRRWFWDDESNGV